MTPMERREPMSQSTTEGDLYTDHTGCTLRRPGIILQRIIVCPTLATNAHTFIPVSVKMTC